MYYRATIQKLAATTMLLLFTIVITPKQWLHDVITGHKHSDNRSGKGIDLRTAKTSFQCNWEHHALESPFVGETLFQLTDNLPVHVTTGADYIPPYYSAERKLTSLRGPPMM